MEVILIFAAIVAVLAALDIAAVFVGVDSRDGFCDDSESLRHAITV